MKCNR